MKKSTYSAALIMLATGTHLYWSAGLMAASNGQLGVSAMVAERCRVDFSEGSADYFQTCTAVDVKASGHAHNVIGETTSVAAADDPYFLDRDPESQTMAAGSAPADRTTRRANAPRVVTIHY